MKLISSVLILFFIFSSCSNKDDDPIIPNPQNQLIITSFSPMEASVGDEIIFIGENIDPTISYSVSFNGVNGETTSVTESEIVARIPPGATSGKIEISYDDKIVNVGTIEITEELDKLYVYFDSEYGCDLLNIYHMDNNTGEILQELEQLYAGTCVEYLGTEFFRDGNILIYSMWERITHDYYNRLAIVRNFTDGSVYKWNLESKINDQSISSKNILAVHDNKIYYIFRYYDSIDDIYEIKVSNLSNSNIGTVHEFPTNFIYDIKNSGFMPSSNELFFFTEDANGQPQFFKVNVETSTLTTNNVSDVFTNIFVTTGERIFGVKESGNNEYEIVEINKTNGNISSSIASVQASEIYNIDYSISSNRIFALIKDGSDQYLYKLNLDNGTSTKTLLDEQNEYPNFYGIYLND